MHYCAKNELYTFMGWGILKPKYKLKMVEIAPNQLSTVQSDAKKTLNLATIYKILITIDGWKFKLS